MGEMKRGGEKTGGGGSILRLASVDTMSGGDGEVGADEDGATDVTSGPLQRQLGGVAVGGHHHTVHDAL